MENGWTAKMHDDAQRLAKKANEGSQEAFWELLEMYARYGYPFKKCPAFLQACRDALEKKEKAA